MSNKQSAIFLASLFFLASCAASDIQPPPNPTATEGSQGQQTPATAIPTQLPVPTEIPTRPPAQSNPFSLPTPTISDAEFVPGGNRRQVLDVYLPSHGAGPYPTVLAFHGGGFRARSKTLYAPLANHFTDQGYALVASNYRYAQSDTPYPAQVEDAFCALGWITTNAAELGFDVDRIFVMGDSAGGYLASMLGTVEQPEAYRGDCPNDARPPNGIRGVVVLYGFYDLVSLEGHSEEDIEGPLEAFMGGPHSEILPDQLIEMSPLSWIDGSEPPFLILHGTEDKMIASWLSEDFASALEEKGVTANLVLLEDQHGFILQSISSPTMTEALDAIDNFIEGSD